MKEACNPGRYLLENNLMDNVEMEVNLKPSLENLVNLEKKNVIKNAVQDKICTPKIQRFSHKEKTE